MLNFTQFPARLTLCAAWLLFSWQAFATDEFPDVSITPIAEGLESPWAFVELPSKAWLVTEKNGRIVKVSASGESTTIGQAPSDIYTPGQGGLLDIKIHPQFDNNGWVYISYSSGTAKANQLAVARARFDGTLGDWEVVFAVFPTKDTPVHYAGRMLFLPDGSLLVTSGDGFDYREAAQRKESLLGKVIRIDDIGRAILDNPFYQGDGQAADFIFTYGHRNAQGLVYLQARNQVILHEHGPAGGDEINLLSAGNNYGWPVVTLGKDYSGASISPFTEYPGMQAPFIF